jgi:hypothetical protein
MLQERIMSATVTLPVTTTTGMAVVEGAAPTTSSLKLATSVAVDDDYYDGDSESVAPRKNSSSDNLDIVEQRTPVKKKKRSAADIGRKDDLEDKEDTDVVAGESGSSLYGSNPIDDGSNGTPCEKNTQALSPMSSQTTTTASSPSETSSSSARTQSSSSPSRKSFSAAVHVSTLQASFAEKTAAEMQEIIGWYSHYNEEDRFTKVDQRQSLPNNAMIVDEESDDDESEGDENIATNNVTDGLTPSTNKKGKSPDGSSNNKTHRAEQVREHLEASDHLIRITQYMAEVITELEHSSSSSGNDEGDSFESNELEMKDAGEADQKDSGVDDETLQRIVQETALLREEYEKRKAQKRNIPTNMEEDSVVFTTWILPILIAIIVAWLWRSRQAVEVGNHL